jgi:arylsulfatase A
MFMKNNMKTIPLLCAVITSVALAREQPNIILIVADDLGYGDTGVYGSDIKTPNVDRLAASGVRAIDAHAASGVCTPSRYAMITGQYYYGNWNGELLVEPERGTIATVLKDNGYKTGYFGKWHLGWGQNTEGRKYRADIDWNTTLPAGVLESGFDYFFGTPFSHNESPMLFVRNRDVIGLEADDPISVIGPKDPGGAPHGKSFGGEKAHAARPTDRIDLVVVDEMVEWIKENKDDPFFATFCLVAPHVPLAVAKEFQGKSNAGVYGDYIMQMDDCIGQVLDTLDELDLTDDTLIIFTSDNGAVLHEHAVSLGHHGNGVLLGQKTDAWEGGHRVPFIASWPGQIPEGETTDSLISLIDLCKTVWAAAKITEWPATAATSSVNQLPALLNPTGESVRDGVYALGTSGYIVREGEWVYIPRQGSGGLTLPANNHWTPVLYTLGFDNSDYDENLELKPDAPETQLYNLTEDLSQSKNVIRDHPEKAEMLQQKYAQFMKSMSQEYTQKLQRRKLKQD